MKVFKRVVLLGVSLGVGLAINNISVKADTLSLENAEINVVDDKKCVYNGSEQKPDIEVYLNGEKLDSSSYTISYFNNVDASVYYGMTYEERLNKVLLSSDASASYQKLLSKEDTEDDEDDNIGEFDEEGEIDYDDYVEDGAFIIEDKPMPRIEIQGVGDYSGSATTFFSIYPKEITAADVSIDWSNINKSYDFEGKDKVPPVLIRDKGNLLNTFIDFVPQYINNFNAGTASLKITGENNYCGELNKTFTIAKRDINNTTVKASYNSKKELVVKCNTGSYTMTEKKDFDYSHKFKSDGSDIVTVNGIGKNYKGTKIVVIEKEDNPFADDIITKANIKKAKKKETVIKKLSAQKGKKIEIKWSRKKDITGYQIQYSKKSNFKSYESKRIKDSDIKAYTFKKMKKGKYYFRIRCYTEIKNKNYYGDYSKIKSVKVKK